MRRKKVLLDKDKWVEFSEKYFQFRKEAYEEISGKENELYFRPLNKTLLAFYESQIDLQVVPDIEGRKMASDHVLWGSIYVQRSKERSL